MYNQLLPPFHNVSHSSIFHIYIYVNESRHIYLFRFINININIGNIIYSKTERESICMYVTPLSLVYYKLVVRC